MKMLESRRRGLLVLNFRHGIMYPSCYVTGEFDNAPFSPEEIVGYQLSSCTT